MCSTDRALRVLLLLVPIALILNPSIALPMDLGCRSAAKIRSELVNENQYALVSGYSRDLPRRKLIFTTNPEGNKGYNIVRRDASTDTELCVTSSYSNIRANSKSENPIPSWLNSKVIISNNAYIEATKDHLDNRILIFGIITSSDDNLGIPQNSQFVVITQSSTNVDNWKFSSHDITGKRMMGYEIDEIISKLNDPKIVNELAAKQVSGGSRRNLSEAVEGFRLTKSYIEAKRRIFIAENARRCDSSTESICAVGKLIYFSPQGKDEVSSVFINAETIETNFEEFARKK